MKILLANSPFYGGGITTYANELIKCLSQDCELTVVLSDDSLCPISIPGVKVLHYDTMELSVKNALFFIKLINEELKPNLVISSFGLIVPIIAPFIHDNIRVITVSHSGKYFNSDYCAFNHKFTDNIIAASSNYNKKYLEDKFNIKDKTKVRVVYNFMASNPELELYHTIIKENKTISMVYAGGKAASKNPDFVLKVLCELLKTDFNFKFYWTGDTTLPLMNVKALKKINPHDIRQFVRKDERVVFTGKIPSKNDFDRLIATSNVLLLPSRNEGCSMLLLEALRSGSICVVGDYKHGNREIVEKGNCGFALSHKQPEQFSKLLADIIINHDKYVQYYDNAYDTYKSKLSYPVWKSSLEALITENKNHSPRKGKISKTRIYCDIKRLKLLQKRSNVGRFFCFSLNSLLSFFFQYIKMKFRGEYPSSSNSNYMFNNQ